MTSPERARGPGGDLPPERWSEVRPLVEAALDLPPARRAAFLDRACGGDAALRDDVERLALACERAAAGAGFLDQPAAAFAAPVLAAMTAPGGAAGGGDGGPDGAAIQATLRAALADRYDVGAELGRGGMAIVYLADDRKHDRRVALKVLNPELGAALGAERFLAEIRVTANLQHPNLLPLFDSGTAGGLLYYVTPYVEGGSLRARLERERQLPVDEAVRLAVAAAGALDYAHRRGVVHRDLKPENILLHDGQPLVADFGIALAVSRAGGARLTQRGLSLGTPQYMSPEQAAVDRAVDGRSDVYSLACVLYELLAGDPPHTGSTVQGVLAKVLGDPVRPVRALRPSTPAHVEAALARALARVPADRFATARAFAEALQQPGAAVAPHAPRRAGLRARLRDPVLLGLGLAAVLGMGAATWLLARDRAAPAPRTARFVVASLGDWPLRSAPTITPDGRALVYAGSAETERSVFVRPLGELRARRLAGTEGAVRAFVSPDGRWIGFFTTDDKLKKVPVAGGPPTVLAGAFRFASASWAPGGAIVTDAYGSRGLSWLADSGGRLRPLTHPDTAGGELGHRVPLVLPGGRAVVFIMERQRGGPAPIMGELAVVPLDLQAGGPARHTLLGVHGRRAVAFVDGWLLYTGSDGASVMAVRFDPERRRTTGAPVAVLRDAENGIDAVALARDGTLLYTRRRATNVPVLVDERGAVQPLLGGSGGTYMNPRLSPDGRRLAIQATTPQGSDVWVYDLESRTPTRLTLSGNAYGPAWTPDGRRVVFLSSRSGRDAFWWQPADGSAPAEKLVEGDGLFAGTVAPDGRTLLFQRQVDHRWGIWFARLDEDRRPRPLLREPFDDYMPAVSPDGRWLAYASNASGRYEVYVRPFAGAGAPVQVSEGGGTEPVWSRDGRLFYRGGRQLLAATVAPGAAFAVTAREPLFADAFDGEMPHSNYDITPDGRRLVMIAAEASSGIETVVVVNWLPELRARLAGH